jgi:tetratricopeptide (TPR) repeat protein
MSKLDVVKKMISDGKVKEAISELDLLISAHQDLPLDQLYYIRGNAYRKLSDWQQALNNYLEAIAINPDSEAQGARQMVMDILNFYHKDYYNP